ncbi:MAG: polysaccharide biosynthesis tyrosine autokinase [Nonlabens sp.]
MSQNNKLKDSDAIQNQIFYYLKKWPWFVLSVLLAVSIAYVYLRYSTNQYRAVSKVMIKDTRRGGISETGALGDLDILGNSFNTVENEIEVLKSLRLMKNVVEELNLQTSFSIEGRIKSADLYKRSPFTLDILFPQYAQQETLSIICELKYIDDSSFHIRPYESIKWITCEYGKSFTIEGQTLVLSYNPSPTNPIEFKRDDLINITIKPVEVEASWLNSRLSVSKTDKRSSVVDLVIIDDNLHKAEDILDKLVEVYNRDAIKDKNIAAQNTARFIDERLKEVQSDLDSIERRIQKFKNDKNLTDLPTESLMGLEATSTISRELVEVKTSISIAKSIKEQLKSSSNEFLPSDLSINGSGSISEQSLAYNQLLNRYLNIKSSTTELSPTRVNLENELENLKNSLIISLENAIDNLRFKQAGLLNERGSVYQKVESVPENERLNRDIERTRKVVEAIFLLLSEKRESTAISLAIATPKAKVVDFAMALPNPVSPNRKIIYLVGLVVGLLIPVIIIYLRRLLYNKIESRADVEQILKDVSILGEIPKIGADEDDYIHENDRSILAEAFRIVRTNLQYIIASVANKGSSSVILVTSTIKGEGKTFTSYNIAHTLAYTGKKVVLLGGDVRNPQIHRYVGKDFLNNYGLTEFLIDPELNAQGLIANHSENKNLSLIHSGKIPPNPAELLLSDRVGLLIDELKKHFDYIIIDSAPTILVTDTFLINKYADVTLYVCRANYTDRALINYIQDTIDSKKLKNVSVIINDVKVSNFGYGRKYTYEYSTEKPGLIKKLKTFFSRN